jgi:hypothetical protein
MAAKDTPELIYGIRFFTHGNPTSKFQNMLTLEVSPGILSSRSFIPLLRIKHTNLHEPEISILM